MHLANYNIILFEGNRLHRDNPASYMHDDDA